VSDPVARARELLSEDPDPETRAELGARMGRHAETMSTLIRSVVLLDRPTIRALASRMADEEIIARANSNRGVVERRKLNLPQEFFAEQMESPLQFRRASLNFAQWREKLRTSPKPTIAAVNGWCLGGGCELAMALDLIIAGEGAKFGQPEIKLGIIPGAGGTQRLTRAIGKSKAMEMILTGEPIGAADAERIGLVSRVVPDELVVEDALALASVIAQRSPFALRIAKEAVNAAYELPLTAGLAHERRLFFLLFASEDQKEGMAAFLEKRDPEFTGR